MAKLDNYLNIIETALMTSEIVAEYTVVSRWTNTDDGYLRIRATLNNGDFLEAATYFVIEDEHPITVDYHYQWMNPAKSELRRRWDNTPHHPEIATFPHHCHIKNENNVLPSISLDMLQLLQFLEGEITGVEN